MCSSLHVGCKSPVGKCLTSYDKKFLNLPNFDADIFEEITGINVKENKTELTLKEVAEKFGVNVDELRIKD